MNNGNNFSQNLKFVIKFLVRNKMNKSVTRISLCQSQILNGSQEDRLVVIPEDFFMISKLFSSNLRMGNSRTFKILSSIEPKDSKDWNIGAISLKYFITKLICT